MFVFVPQPPDPGLILRVHLKTGDLCYLPPHPHSPFSISLIVCCYRALSFHQGLICVAGRPSGLFGKEPSPSNTIPLCPGSPCFEKGSWVFKKWTGSWAIQGVSNASRSAKLLNAKQTVEQIKIKGSSLARLACCPHMPGGAVTVNHGQAASMLMLTPEPHPPPPKSHQPPQHITAPLLVSSNNTRTGLKPHRSSSDRASSNSEESDVSHLYAHQEQAFCIWVKLIVTHSYCHIICTYKTCGGSLLIDLAQ